MIFCLINEFGVGVDLVIGGYGDKYGVEVDLVMEGSVEGVLIGFGGIVGWVNGSGVELVVIFFNGCLLVS